MSFVFCFQKVGILSTVLAKTCIHNGQFYCDMGF